MERAIDANRGQAQARELGILGNWRQYSSGRDLKARNLLFQPWIDSIACRLNVYWCRYLPTRLRVGIQLKHSDKGHLQNWKIYFTVPRTRELPSVWAVQANERTSERTSEWPFTYVAISWFSVIFWYHCANPKWCNVQAIKKVLPNNKEIKEYWLTNMVKFMGDSWHHASEEEDSVSH